MFSPDDLVSGVLTGIMGGRRKRSKKALKYLTGRSGSMLSNPQTLLTVAGVAWGIFESLQNQQGQPQPQAAGSFGSPAASGTQPPAPVTPAAPLPPLPTIPGAANVPDDALRMVRLSIAAASADGTLSDDDRAKIVEQARSAGAEHLVEYELNNRRPVSEIAAGVSDPAQRATLYVLAFGIIRADESVSGAERIFLAQLANQLGLDPATVAKLETNAAARIDAQQ
jgi:uncharacterized membrane protein YebE (DUF533 family)